MDTEETLVVSQGIGIKVYSTGDIVNIFNNFELSITYKNIKLLCCTFENNTKI